MKLCPPPIKLIFRCGVLQILQTSIADQYTKGSATEIFLCSFFSSASPSAMVAQAPPGVPPGTDLWATPAGQPPPGVESNLINPETNKNIVHITLSILLILATVFLALRLYVQLYVVKHGLGWDDCKQISLGVVSKIVAEMIDVY